MIETALDIADAEGLDAMAEKILRDADLPESHEDDELAAVLHAVLAALRLHPGLVPWSRPESYCPSPGSPSRSG